MTNQEFIDSFRQDQKQENWWYRFHPITKMIFCLALGFMSLFVFKWQVGLVIFLIASVIAMTTPIYKKYFQNTLTKNIRHAIIFPYSK